MIVRQFCARHGRTVLSQSTRPFVRSVSSINVDDPSLRPSEQDHKPRINIPGHPDATSGILDTIDKPPTAATRAADKLVSESQKQLSALQAEVQNASRILNLNQVAPSPQVQPETPSAAPIPGTSAKSKTPKWPRDPGFVDTWKPDRLNLHEIDRFFAYYLINRNRGTDSSKNRYDPRKIVTDPPKPNDLTLPMLLANQCHLGHATSLWNPANSGYIYGVRDGIHIISLDITYSYLKRAAKVIEEVARRGGIILFVGTRDGFRDIVVNAAKRAKGYHIFDRWVPGTLTNGQQILGSCSVQIVDRLDQKLDEYNELLTKNKHQVMRPDLVVCLNPMENQVLLQECGLFTIPTIGIIDTDANPSWVTYPIPANDDSLRSVSLIAGTLSQAAKEGQRLRLQAAESGRTPYLTAPVDAAISLTKALAAVEVQERSQEEDSGGKRKRYQD